jgi:LysM repeat protein
MKIIPAWLLIILIVFSCKTSRVPTGSYVSQSRQEYIAKYHDFAIEEMNSTGIPASITLAQALLESGDGNSTLARNANNHFGIKCHNDWNGRTYRHDDDRKRECFRKYNSVVDSYRDHSEFLKGKSRYAFLFKLDPADYKGWSRGLKQAGYATNPKYARLLIGIIEDNRLYMYDRGGKVTEIQQTDHVIASEQADNGNLFIDDENEFTIRTGARKISQLNRIDYIITRPGDTFESLTRELGLMKWELSKYNDLPENVQLEPGWILFLQPKRSQAEQGKNFRIVKKNDNMRSISQEYGIKLTSLYQINGMKDGEQPQPGQKIWLRKNKK